MIFLYDNSDKTPAYQQLYRAVREEILKGAFPRNSKLPSKRTLAEQTGVSVLTVEHAYTLLEDEGYVEARERSGYFVIYQAEDFLLTDAFLKQKKRESEIGATDVEAVDEVLAETGLIAPQADPGFSLSIFSKTMRKVLLDYGELLMRKSPSFGEPILRTQISSYLARSRAMFVKPEQIVIGSGAEYLYGLLAQFLSHMGSFAIENPSYEKIRQVYEAEGIPLEYLNMDSGGILSRDLAEAKSRVLHVTPFHSFPSGATADISKKREYVRWARSREGVIIEDNYDSELTVSRKMEDTLFSLSGGERVIYLNTFSKTIAASIRVGYMVLPENMLEEFKASLGFYSCTVPALEQFFLAELLKNGDFERHINKVRRYRRQSRSIIGLT